MVTLAPPLLVIFSVNAELLPTVTLPKLRLAGFGVRSPGEIPVPVRGIVNVGSDASEVIVTLPLSAPAEAGSNETLKLALCPAVRVSGVEIPLRLNPVPVIATCEIVTDDPPVLVIFSVRDGSLPTVTLPKLRLVGFAPSVPCETPVPDRAIVKVELEASETMVTEPVALPAACGAKLTVNVVLCEGLSVSGVVRPVNPKPAPLTEACETETGDPPMLVSVTVCVCWLPTVTLPKVSLAGLRESCPELVAAVPVPVRLRVVVFEASLVMVTDALKAPTVSGQNVRLTVVLCPDASVSGRLGEVREKY